MTTTKHCSKHVKDRGSLDIAFRACGKPATHVLLGEPMPDSHLHPETVAWLAEPTRGRCAEHAAVGAPATIRLVQWRLVPLDAL